MAAVLAYRRFPSAALVWTALGTLAATGQIEVWHVLGVSFLAGSVGAFEDSISMSRRRRRFVISVDRGYLVITSRLCPSGLWK